MILENAEFARSLSQSLRQHWRLTLGEGIFLSVLGVMAILLPLVAGLVMAIGSGWLLFLGGFVGLITSVAMRRTPSFWWSAVSSIIAMAAGAILFMFPIGGIVSLTFLLAIFLFVDGVLTIFLALSHREWASPNWDWLLFNGILDLFLAVVIFVLLPAVAVWVVGTIIGIDLIFGGFSLITMALAAHRSKA